MSRHLSDEALLDLLEERLGAEGASHLEACASCRKRLDEARGGLALAAGGGDVPEPTPAYWGSFRARVSRGFDEEILPPRRRLFGPWALLPLAAAAALLFALLPRTPGPSPASPAPTLPAWEALSAEDASLLVLEGLADAGDDLESAAGCRDVADCLSGLTDEESRDLAAALRQAWPEAAS